jgi:hypothetical protein
MTGVIFSYYNGRTKLPGAIFVLGILDLLGIFFVGIGPIGLAFLALLAVVVLISLKLDFA